MKHFKLIFSILVLLQIAQTALGNEEVTARIDTNGAVYVNQGGSEALVGEVQVLKKGTKLYHWGNASAEQAKAWHAAGKISPELVAKLRLGSGFAGGGFYASKDPIDSMQFGNTLVVIELPQDIKIINTAEMFWWDKGSLDSIEKLNLSAVIVAHTKSWMNIIDANALTKEIVADADFFKRNPIGNIPQPHVLTDFLERFPALKDEPFYQKLTQDSERLLVALRSPDPQQFQKALIEVLKKGSNDMKLLALTHSSVSTNSSVLNREIIDYLLPLAFENSRMSGNTITFIYKNATHNKPANEYLFSKITGNANMMQYFAKLITTQLSPEKASAILQDAQTKLASKTPIAVTEAVAGMKAAGTWNPPLMCSKVFL